MKGERGGVKTQRRTQNQRIETSKVIEKIKFKYKIFCQVKKRKVVGHTGMNCKSGLPKSKGKKAKVSGCKVEHTYLALMVLCYRTEPSWNILQSISNQLLCLESCYQAEPT